MNLFYLVSGPPGSVGEQPICNQRRNSVAAPPACVSGSGRNPSRSRTIAPFCRVVARKACFVSRSQQWGSPLKLLYDQHDLPHAKKLRDGRFRWLADLGASELSTASLNEAGFLFGYEHGDAHYRKLVGNRPNVRDRPDERQELLHLDEVLKRLAESKVEIPTPKTWVIGVDDDLPDDVQFPLFVRTPKSSWKRGGQQGRANNQRELADEMELLRRAFGWDTSILARQWIDVAAAGRWMFGEAPQEVRVWIVDHVPVAWSFHYLHAVRTPKGFPPSDKDLQLLAELAAKVGGAFGSRLIVADFIRDRQGDWHFLEAGPGAVAGTAHEAVFKFVAEMIRGTATPIQGDAVGGAL